jgi:hypothetical protein
MREGRSSVTTLIYVTGEAIQAGDRVRYHGEQGRVDFVVTDSAGQASLDWYLREFPGGGAMIVAEGFGSVFLTVDDLDDFLEFVARKTDE